MPWALTADSPQQPTPNTPGNDPNDPFYGDASGFRGLTALGKQGITLGLSDEAAGVGGAIAGLLLGKNPVDEYRKSRDAEMDFVNRAREAHPILGTALEFAGGGGALRIGAGGNALLQGATIGGLGGFGYGRGAEDSLAGTTTGAALGAGMAFGLDKIGNALMPRISQSVSQRAARGVQAQRLQQAGQAEGVTVNRAMVDPRLQNRLTGVDATMAGGPRVQREMSRIEGQIEQGVDRLGRGGAVLEDIERGDMIANAADRFIKSSGQSAAKKYDRAEQLAAGLKVQPNESLSRVDDMLTTLKETPDINKAEIAFLEGIRNDLSNDLSVGALRRMRTSLRQKISKGELTFGEDEARVLSIMDGASEDIATGLVKSGNSKAARAFDVADKAYRARMDYINGTVQKIIGKRNANLSAEQIAGRFDAMARGKDARGLRKFYSTLNPEEQADVAATFASEMGRNNKGEFSVSHFLTQSEKMSPTAIRTIFGDEGAKSIENLRVLGKEVSRVTGSMNSRKSGTAVGNNWRSWIVNLVLGGSLGALTQGGTGLATGAALAGGTTVGRDILSARALMSPNITKWLRQAPATTSANAIDTHIGRLRDIVKVEPALAHDVEGIMALITRAANDNAGVRLSASDGKEDE